MLFGLDEWILRSPLLIRSKRALFRWLFALLRRIRPVRLPDRRLVPRPLRRMVFVPRWRGLREMLANDADFAVDAYGSRMRETGADFFLGHDRGGQRDSDRGAALLALEAADLPRVFSIARAAAERAIERSQRGLGVRELDGDARASVPVPLSCHLDVVRELGDPVFTDVTREFFGLRDPGQLLEWVQLTSWYIFNPLAGPDDRRRALRAGEEMQVYVRALVASGSAPPKSVLETLKGQLPTDVATDVAIARTITGLVAGFLGPPPRQFVKAVDRLLDLRGRKRRELVRAARDRNYAAVRAYLLEAGRFAPDPSLLYRRCNRDTTLDGRRIEAGDTVVGFVDSALMDGSGIERPRRFRVGRDPDSQMLFGHGIHECIGREIGLATLCGMTAPLFALPRLRRARGNAGMIQFGTRGLYPEQNYPQHLKVRFDPRWLPARQWRRPGS